MSGERKVSPAPDWRPGPSAPLRKLKGMVADRGLPEGVRVQAALEIAVHHGAPPPDLGGWDAGAAGAARGAVERVELDVLMPDPRGDGVVRRGQVVVRRARDGLRGLSPWQRAVAERYAGLVEQLEAVRVIAEGGGCGGVSDGGASARLWIAEAVRAARRAVGEGTVTFSVRTQMDRPRGRPVTALALVDGVCLRDLSLGAVLEAHGWPRAKRAELALGEALRDAVDRMEIVLGVGDRIVG